MNIITTKLIEEYGRLETEKDTIPKKCNPLYLTTELSEMEVDRLCEKFEYMKLSRKNLFLFAEDKDKRKYFKLEKRMVNIINKVYAEFCKG